MPASDCRATRTRCSTRTSGSPPATAWTASSSTCPSRRACVRATSCCGCSTACASTHRTWARRPSSRASTTCSTAATGPRARWSCTRRTTTSARWWPRSWRRRRHRGGAPSRGNTGEGILGQVSEPDLFVVCKNCSSEVSPYVTECPYCGQRVRKRAPKIERRQAEEEGERRRRRVRPPRLSPLKRGEIPGIAPETRPYGTMAVIAISLAVTLALATSRVSLFDVGGVLGPIGSDYWRLVTAPFVYDTSGPFYEFVVLVAIGVFGTMVERRFGSVAMVLLFLAAGAGGAALALGLDSTPALGGNGAALGL